MKKLIIIIALSPMSIFGQNVLNGLYYSEPKSTYSGEAVDEMKALSKSISDTYESNKSNYEETINLFKQKTNSSKTNLQKDAVQYCYHQYNNDLYEYIVGGNWQDASFKLEEANKKINSNYKAYLNEKLALIKLNNENGFDELEKKNYDAAIKWFKKSVREDENDLIANYGIALAFRMQEKFNESISKCDILIGLEPKEASFYSLRGRNYFDLKKYGSAVTDLEYSISLKSDDRDLFFLGVAKNKAQDYIGSTKILNKYIENNLTDESGYFYRAINKSELKDYDGAINDYKKCIEINPKASMAYNNIAWIKYIQKDYKLGLIYVNKAIEFEPTNVAAIDTRAEIKYSLADYKGAIQDCNNALSFDSYLSNIYFIRGKSELKLSKKKEACADLSKAGELGKIEAYEVIEKSCK